MQRRVVKAISKGKIMLDGLVLFAVALLIQIPENCDKGLWH